MTPEPRTWAGRLRSVGPGVVFVFTVMGPSDLVANTAAGATHGYALLWVLALAVVFRFMWLNLSARFVLVTGDTLIAGLARYGRAPLWIAFGAMLMFRHVSNLAKMLLAGNALQILLPLPAPLGAKLWSVAFLAAGYAVLVAGGYEAVERACKIAVVTLGVTLLAAALAAGPDPAAVARGLIPSLPASQGLFGTWLIVMALIGTEAGSLTNISYSYFVWRKGWRDVSAARRQRADLILSVCGLFLAGVLLQVTAASAFSGVTQLRSVDDLARVFTGRFGQAGLMVFSAGLLGQVYLGLVGGTTGYALAGADIWRLLRARSSPTPAPDTSAAPQMYRALIAFWIFSPLYALFTTWKPVTLALASSLVMAAFIPLLAAGLLLLTNDRSRMGAHAARPAENLALIALALISAGLLWATLWPMLHEAAA
ncbi:MAG TPA: Nramp family divalent metal transporter [Vicinamibacterales bacterium]|nr:Nramp family divalent metal transporter [Vicinamibacterales bacterium]